MNMTRTSLINAPVPIGTTKGVNLAYFIFDAINLNELNYTTYAWVETQDRALIIEIYDIDGKKLGYYRVGEQFSGAIQINFENPFVCTLLRFHFQKENDGGVNPKIYSMTLNI